MAAPKSLQDYVGKELRLPHRWWGDVIARKSYPDEWKTGYQLVTLGKFVPAKKGNVDSLQFVADDGEDYLIIEKELKQYWKEKRFKGNSVTIYCSLLHYPSLYSPQLTLFYSSDLVCLLIEQTTAISSPQVGSKRSQVASPG